MKLHLTGFKYSLMIKTLIKSVHLHQYFEDSWIATIEHIIIHAIAVSHDITLYYTCSIAEHSCY